jgi:uncharacterized protein (DUF342 family)
LQPVKVVVSENKMAAFILIAPDYKVTAEDLRDALRREGVTTGISPKALLEAVTGTRGMIYQVAWGIPPKGRGHSPSQVSLVFTYADSKGRPRDHYVVDSSFKSEWRRLLARGAVSGGEVLASVRTTAGLPVAKAVTGEEVPFVPSKDEFRLGPNTAFSPDGLKIVATRAGIPYVDKDGAGVLEHVAVEGDVCSLTGNLSFPGDLTVRGNVEAGFSAFAVGDLLISGHVWGSVTARGRIVVSGGITAPGEVVESGGGISCKFCENSVIRSQGPITIQEAALHSVIETESAVDVIDPKGRIIGGLTRAAVSLKAPTVGTPMGVPTVIELGISPKIRREVARLERDLEKVVADLARLQRMGGVRTVDMTDLDSMRIARARRNLQEKEEAIRRRLELLTERLEGMPKGYFQAQRVLPGTRLVMGTEVHEFTSSIDRISMGVRNA